jgi:transposase
MKTTAENRTPSLPARIDAGVDISKATLDFSVAGELSQIPNTAPEIRRKLAGLSGKHGESLRVSCESTGRYGHVLIALCLELGIEICQLNPSEVREFAKSQKLLAKTDRIDAGVIARFSAYSNPRPLGADWADRQEAACIHSRMRALVAIAAAQKASLDHFPDKSVRREILATIRTLETKIARYEKRLLEVIEENRASRELYAILTNEPGVGPRTAIALIVHLPELGKLGRNGVAALAGIAPMNCDSGKFRGKRRIQGGRKLLRGALYSAAVVAARFNPLFKTFYQRLRDNGKPAKVAYIAVARKLLIRLNTLAKNRPCEI